MKTLFVILSIFFLSVSLFANDSCFVNATLTGITTGSGVNGPVTATLSGNVTNKSGNTISANVTGQVSGSIVGSISGTITATITNSTTGLISGNFVGVATGIASGSENPSQSVTCNANGNANGNIICIPVIESESDCGQPLDCPAGVKYPYTFCDPTTNQLVEKCAEDPIEFAQDNNLTLLKKNLPMIPSPLFFISNAKYYHYTGVQLVESSEKFADKFSDDGQWVDAFAACNRWNCVCGDTIDYNKPIPNEIYDRAYFINIEFTDNPNIFVNLIKKPDAAKTALAITDKKIRDNCSVDEVIYFNATPDFLYEKGKFPDDNTNYQLKNGWYNQKFLSNAESIKDMVYLYNFMEVAMHEIGHILGFGHFKNKQDMAGGLVSECEVGTNGVMDSLVSDLKYGNRTELSDYDKCMMSKLYCPTISIYEYEPQTQKVYPNPGEHIVTINFELPQYTENLKMSIRNVLGQIVLIPIENGVYEAGEQSILINVDALPVGVYYIIIEAGAYLSAQPITIIR